MRKFKAYAIPFVGLKVEQHRFDYKIDNSFFELFDFNEFNNADVSVDLELTKKANMLELEFEFTGHVNVNCDLTLEPYNQQISNHLSLVVKFGDDYNNDNEELLILPHSDYEVEIQQYIYEGIILGLPAKRVHPGVEDGSIKSEILEKLNELQPEQNTKEEDTDPRWDKLKELLNE
ncbi:metal and nucleic acid binding protein [Psychroflexus torquis ATCC 700755]|uniref:Metal and nucleic acid binding protein n=1 Tax=Psychroflexus torquis (strain ATCC 700755 / CIP 106069 / ACAM 623) TaxID=313595 RepID=K4IIT9_PSYTT|nr:YceD family protein [Psychroflexus torquis]AFU68996.1 metal and nucleic acid binding protein [Psychroflexus torquis ATCC 700755]